MSNRQINSNAQSIGEFFRRPISYHVPSYQRDFAWTDEQIDELWTDIVMSLEEGRREYFLGAIVISKRDDKEWDIVDGQQRLAAISVIFAAIASRWEAMGDGGRASGIIRDYLGTENRRTQEIVPKLSLNETNNPTFQSLVLERRDVATNEERQLSYSNKLLVKAFRRIKHKLDDWLKRFEDIESALLDLEEFIADSTNLIVIEAGDDSDAFVIFETLNDRGLALAPPDLIKNYLFSLAENHLDQFKRAWHEISILVGSENLTQFLRHYWLSEYGLVRERDLYRALRNSIKNRIKARQLIERLQKAAYFYAALMNPEHSYWDDFPQKVRDYLEALDLFKVTQFRPVALAAMEQGDVRLIERTLRMLMVISFRYTVISALSTSNLEKVYTDAALAIRHGKIRHPAQLFGYLRDVYVDDERFVQDFASKRMRKPQIARYSLAKINDFIQQQPELTVSDRVTLEHILPRSPGDEWKNSIPPNEDVLDYVDLIGNLTLLEKGRNRKVGNTGFAEKRKVFVQSNLAINRDIVNKKRWSYQEIEERSKKLAEYAKNVWRLDY